MEAFLRGNHLNGDLNELKELARCIAVGVLLLAAESIINLYIQ